MTQSKGPTARLPYGCSNTRVSQMTRDKPKPPDKESDLSHNVCEHAWQLRRDFQAIEGTVGTVASLERSFGGPGTEAAGPSVFRENLERHQGSYSFNPGAHNWTANQLDEALQGSAWDFQSAADWPSAQSADSRYSRMEVSQPAIHGSPQYHVQTGRSAAGHTLLTSAACACQVSGGHAVHAGSTAQVYSSAAGAAPGQMSMDLWQPAVPQSAPHPTANSMTSLSAANEAGRDCTLPRSPVRMPSMPCEWTQQSQVSAQRKRRKRHIASSESAKIHFPVAGECQAAEASTLPPSAIACQCTGRQAEGCCAKACLWPQLPQGQQLLCSCSPSPGSTASMSEMMDHHLCWGQDIFQWNGNPGSALLGGLHSPVLVNGDIQQGLGATASLKHDFPQPLMGVSDCSDEAFFQALLPGEQGSSTQQFGLEPHMMTVPQQPAPLPAEPHSSCVLHQRHPTMPLAACADAPWTALPKHPSPVKGLRIRSGRGLLAELQHSGRLQTSSGTPPDQQAQALGPEPHEACAEKSALPMCKESSEDCVLLLHLAEMATSHQASALQERVFANNFSLQDLSPVISQAQQTACSSLPVETMSPSRNEAHSMRLLYNSNKLSCVGSPRPPTVGSSTSELEWAQAPSLQSISPYDPVHHSQDNTCPPCIPQESPLLMSGHADTSGLAGKPISFQKAVSQAGVALGPCWLIGGRQALQPDRSLVSEAKCLIQTQLDLLTQHQLKHALYYFASAAVMSKQRRPLVNHHYPDGFSKTLPATAAITLLYNTYHAAC